MFAEVYKLYTMDIIFEDNKICKIFRDFVSDPSSRTALKNFRRYFEQKIESSATRLHSRLQNVANAKIYNELSGHNNKLELVSGCKDNTEQKFKVRIDQEYRKFFFYLCNEEYCLAKDWTGNFEHINRIYIYDINKHKYD